MPRAPSGAARHRGKERLFKAAKGYRGGRSKFRLAKEGVVRAGVYAYRDRRARKRDFRRLWITRLSAACQMRDLSYSRSRRTRRPAHAGLCLRALGDREQIALVTGYQLPGRYAAKPSRPLRGELLSNPSLGPESAATGQNPQTRGQSKTAPGLPGGEVSAQRPHTSELDAIASSKMQSPRLVTFLIFSFIVFAAPVDQAFAAPERKSFDSAGVKIHFTEQGEGVPVVLLHGFAVNASMNWGFSGIAQKLSSEFRVIAPDLRGHGVSGKPHDPKLYGVEMANDVVRLLDHLNIQKAHLVGYSLGGFIALRLAVDHPDRLLSVSPCGSGWEPPENAAFFNTMERFAESLESGKGVEPLGGQLGGDRIAPTKEHKGWVKFVTTFLNDKEALAAMIRGLKGLTITKAELSAIKLPVCSIVGGQDTLMASLDNMRGLVENHTILILDGADHLQALRRPEFFKTLKDFLKTLPSVDGD